MPKSKRRCKRTSNPFRLEDDPFLMALIDWGFDSEPYAFFGGPVRDGPDFSPSELAIIDAVMDIYEALRALPPRQARAWPRTPNDNQLFGGRPPLEMMLTGHDGLDRVRRFLWAQNGGPL